MNNSPYPESELLLNGESYDASPQREGVRSRGRWGRRVLIGVLLAETCLAVPKYAHAQFGIFNAIFSSIQSDIGNSLNAVNQIAQQTQKLYQTTVAPLTAINQARGFVANSINSFRGQMNHIFNTSFTSATTPGPQQFEGILHSRLSSQIPDCRRVSPRTMARSPH